MTAAEIAPRRSQRRQAGHTLLEWLIAAALGLVVLAGALVLYRSQRDTFMRSADAAWMREAGAAALTIVGQHIQLAGFAPVDQPALRLEVMPGVFGCQGMRPVSGGRADDFACVRHPSNPPDSDGLVVRYADDAIATWASASGEPTDCLGQGVERQGEYALIVNRFYVSQPAGREEPELYCVGNGHARTPQPLVEGIERLSLRYWLHGADEPIGARSIAPAKWVDVVAVDLCVVVRGRRPAGGASFVDCDGRRAQSKDGRDRLSLSRHLIVRNHEAAL